MSFMDMKNTIEFIEAALGSVVYSGQQNTYAMGAVFRALNGLKDELDARIHQEQQEAAEAESKGE